MGATIDDEVRDRPNSELWLPYSHAAGYDACGRTDLAAVADPIAEKAEAIAKRYRAANWYTDYREMVEKEQPDVVSVATRPTPNCEIVCFLAEAGVKGIYCEKPLARSMAEADRMLDACTQHGVKFNYGTQRRYAPLGRKIRGMIDSGELGAIQCVVGYCGASAALWGLTHAADLLLCFAGDPEIEFVQGTVTAKEEDWDGDRLNCDPGITSLFVQFKNGVRGYLVSGGGLEFEVCGSKGKVRTESNGTGCKLRKVVDGQPHMPLEESPLEVELKSGTLLLIEDLVDAIETGREPIGNITLAHRSFEMTLAAIESHRQGGRRVGIPMANRDLYVGRPDW